MNVTNEVNEELLIDYLSNKLSRKKVQLVEEWINLSEDNRNLLEQLYYVQILANSQKAIESADADASYKVFEYKLRKKQRSDVYKKVLFYTRQVAALLTIPLLIASIYLYTKSSASGGFNQYVVAKSNFGMISQVDLPDGTKVWLNSNSQLKYPVKFDSSNRLVELEGEAFFEVEKNKEKPFIVKVDEDYSVRVVGTSFNVVALKNDETIETTLVEGIVDLYVDRSENIYRLKPGDKSVFNKKDKVVEINSVNAYNHIAWKDGVLVFKSTSMEQVLRVLERNYNVKFNLNNVKLGGSTLTAKFEHQQLYQILEFIKLASGIEFEVVEHKDQQIAGATNINVSIKKNN